MAIKSTLSIAAMLLLSTEAYSQSCIPTSRSKTLPVKNFDILRGDGGLGAEYRDFVIVINEERYADCRILTTYRNDWKQKNFWHKGHGNSARATYSISFTSQGRVTWQNALSYSWQSWFCGPYGGAPGKPLFQKGNLQHNYFDITDDFILEPTAISGRIGIC